MILTLWYICHKIKEVLNEKFRQQKQGEKIFQKGWSGMKTFEDYKKQQMQDPELVREYEAIQPEMDVIRAIVNARTSQNLTQNELAKRTGINQADISKLENGTRNPSVNLLKRLAEGMGMSLKIEFIPKQKVQIYLYEIIEVKHIKKLQ